MCRKSFAYTFLAVLFLVFAITASIILWSHNRSSSSLQNHLVHTPDLPEPSQIYGIVIDAGSTGTRILGFKFERNGSELVLQDELWRQEKPGLSSLTPEDAKDQIITLLGYAENFVPKEFWKQTPLKLKATAGFRLLKSEKSEEILTAIREVFRDSKFATSSDSVEIIDGTDEGIYGWFSINYLRHLLSSNNRVAILDLGGGSTQVTYEISNNYPEYLKHYVHDVKNFNGNSKLFVKSYLGLGLMALRHAIITKDAADENELNVESDCMNSDTRPFEWKYQNLTYKISPKSTDNSTFDDCVTAIRKIVSELMKPRTPSLQNQTINAFSYFFDRSIDARLIKNDDEGEEIEVQRFRHKAIDFCENKKGNDTWLCLDLTYMTVLLQDGYGLEDDKKIKIFTKINKHEANWALGSFLLDYISRPRRT